MFASSPSPFKVSAHEDIGLGVERRSKRRRRWRRGFQLMAWLVSISLMVWVFQGGLQWFLKTFVWSNQVGAERDSGEISGRYSSRADSVD